MINLELSRKIKAGTNEATQLGYSLFRSISRKYDRAEHERPIELDQVANLIDALSAAGKAPAGASLDSRKKSTPREEGTVVNGGNMRALLNIVETCAGDVALTLSVPKQGLGNSAIASVANPEQLERFAGVWASMAITEPSFGSDSAAVTTTARLEGDHYVINGEKIYVTAGSRADHVVVWASVDRSKGRAAIKSFVVPRETEGLTVARLEHKLGIKASDTATLIFDNVKVPKENLLGDPEVHVGKGFAGVMQTFDNTRPLVAGMAIGCARGALEELRVILENAGIDIDYDTPPALQSAAAAAFLELEANWESAYLLALKAAWMADNKQPNSMEASMSKAKAGRVGSQVTLAAVELASTLGYSEELLLEKWSRDSKILDIFEGTQQIQNLIVARRLLGLSSSELK